MQYATGNVAKARIIHKILSNADKGTLVYDHGCGDGRQWRRCLNDHPELSYVGFEPSAERAAEATRKLPDRATIYSDSPPTDLAADFVVSFSVFEHVADRRAYLETIESVLAPSGRAYLNYDDGHFRNSLDLNNPSKWPRQLKAWVHTHIGPLFSITNDSSRYQKRVRRRRLEQLLEQTELEVLETQYENLASLKALSAKVPDEKQASFTELWSEFEGDLNELLADVDGATTPGDSNVLWDEALSRTVVLARAP